MYYGMGWTIAFLVALLGIIPLGLFLCRYRLKFVLLSIIGLALVTLYLSQSTLAIVNLLQAMGKNTARLLFEYALPVIFFFAGAFGIARYGVQIRANHASGKRVPPPSPIEEANFRPWWTSFHWFATREGIAVCIVAAVVLTIHVLYVSNPPAYNATNPRTANGILDEGYYVTDAIRLLQGQSMAYPEHPPLGKWFIASGIFIFGDNAVGWRAFSILFAIAAILIFYFICKRLVSKRSGAMTFVPLLATFLLASENLTFVMGQAAMLDVFYVTFMLLGFLFYLRGNYMTCGIAMGLSLLCKETAILPIIAIFLHWALTRRSEIALEIRDTWTALQEKSASAPLHSNILSMFALAVTIALVWSVLIIPLDYPGMHQYPSSTQWFNPISRAVYMVYHPLSQDVSSGVGIGHLTFRYPWQWLLTPSALDVDYASIPSTARYLASIGWALWPLIIPSMGYLLYEAIKNRTRGQNLAFFVLSWFAVVYGLLVIIEVLTNRLMYDFYFYPAIPAVCLGIAWGAWKLWERARGRVKTRRVFFAGLSLYLAATVATFIIMSPMGTNLVKLPLS